MRKLDHASGEEHTRAIVSPSAAEASQVLGIVPAHVDHFGKLIYRVIPGALEGPGVYALDVDGVMGAGGKDRGRYFLMRYQPRPGGDNLTFGAQVRELPSKPPVLKRKSRFPLREKE